MKHLDENYRKLVIEKYITRNSDISDKEELEQRAANTTVNRALIIDIAKDIAKCIDDWRDEDKTVPFFSYTTLARIMGHIKNANEIKPDNLDRIARYLGLQNWAELASVDAEAILEKDNIMSVMDDGERAHGCGLRRLLSHNLQKGQIVEVCYGKGRQLVLEKLSGADRFKIRYCDSDVLKEGRDITIPFFFVGVNVVGLDVCENQVQVKAYYKSGGVITSIKVLNSMWQKPTKRKF